jgi:hypothetical protein
MAPALMLAFAGCSSSFGLPRLFHPGPIDGQQYAAEKAGQTPDDRGSPAENGNGIFPPGYIPRAEAQQSRNFIPNPAFQPSQSYYRVNSSVPSNVNRPGLFPSADASAGGTGGGGSTSFY